MDNCGLWLSIITTLDVNRSRIYDWFFLDHGSIRGWWIRYNLSRLCETQAAIDIFLKINSAVLKSLHSSDTIGPRPSKFQHSSLSIFNEITILPISLAKRKIYRRPIEDLDNIVLSLSWSAKLSHAFRIGMTRSRRGSNDKAFEIQIDRDREDSLPPWGTVRARALRLSHLLFYARSTGTW